MGVAGKRVTSTTTSARSNRTRESERPRLYNRNTNKRSMIKMDRVLRGMANYSTTRTKSLRNLYRTPSRFLLDARQQCLTHSGDYGGFSARSMAELARDPKVDIVYENNCKKPGSLLMMYFQTLKMTKVTTGSRGKAIFAEKKQ
ncbi:hypothetical protein TRVL_09741 [Trypanosoma vivax]|nr:hypothetical protein TRVL_09741 [Trypanosoma vivax]